MINNAYARLLPKEDQTIEIPHQFLCPYSNISACLPIEGQNQVCQLIMKDYLSSISSLQ